MHWFGVGVSIWQDEVAVRMLVEVYKRAFLLLLRRGRHATGHGDSFGIECGRRWQVLRLPVGLVEIGLPAVHLLKNVENLPYAHKEVKNEDEVCSLSTLLMSDMGVTGIWGADVVNKVAMTTSRPKPHHRPGTPMT